jgi:hypothetical protein
MKLSVRGFASEMIRQTGDPMRAVKVSTLGPDAGRRYARGRRLPGGEGSGQQHRSAARRAREDEGDANPRLQRSQNRRPRRRSCSTFNMVRELVPGFKRMVNNDPNVQVSSKQVPDEAFSQSWPRLSRSAAVFSTEHTRSLGTLNCLHAWLEAKMVVFYTSRLLLVVLSMRINYGLSFPFTE